MQEEKSPCRPGSYSDFLDYLSTVQTEKELFSRLTYWYAFQTSPEDVQDRPMLVGERARELKLWNGLELKLERWRTKWHKEFERVGAEEFAVRIAEDYHAYTSRAQEAAPALPAPACLADVPMEGVSWLIPGLLPLGEVSLLGADGGTGKGIWQAQLVAAVTKGNGGTFFPELAGEPGGVLIFSGEDSPSKVLKARMLAAGADMSRVSVLTNESFYAGMGRPLSLTDKEFGQIVTQAKPRLVIVDPLQSFLPGKVEMASRNQMRSSILPLCTVCAQLGCAGLIVMHTNKKQNVSGRGRLSDSSDIWDMARSVLMMGRDKNTGKLYLSHEKSNYAKPALTTLLHIEDAEVDGVRTARAVYDGQTTKRDADFVGEQRVRAAQTKEDTADAIRNVLAESRLGSMPSSQLRAEVIKEVGCSEKTYDRAYRELVKAGEIHKRAVRQKDGKNMWYSFPAYCGGANDQVPI